jgi:hypothetical protein
MIFRLVNITTFVLLLSFLNFSFGIFRGSTLHAQDYWLEEEKTPRQYLEEASKRLKTNYIQEMYSSTAFLRRYKKFDGEYVGLSEVQATVLFNVQPNRKVSMNNQAIYVRQLRQTDPERTANYQRFGFRHPFMKDPVTHQQGNILDPKVFRYAKLEFEPDFGNDYVVIRYTYDNLTPRLFTGNVDGQGSRSELGRETGTIKIDRNTYAILRIESEAVYRREYNPGDSRYFVSKRVPLSEDFKEAKLVIEYGEHMGKYYLRKLFLKQNVDLYKSGTYVLLGNYEIMKEYHFSVPAQALNFQPSGDFVARPYISKMPCNYDPSKWKVQLPPFHFHEKRDVYFALERHQTLEEQFSCDKENASVK